MATDRSEQWWLDKAKKEEGQTIGAASSCSLCAKYAAEGFGPSHNGSRLCESGSIASGGKRSHCTCDVCF